jgi:hypothetical protein
MEWLRKLMIFFYEERLWSEFQTKIDAINQNTAWWQFTASFHMGDIWRVDRKELCYDVDFVIIEVLGHAQFAMLIYVATKLGNTQHEIHNCKWKHHTR